MKIKGIQIRNEKQRNTAIPMKKKAEKNRIEKGICHTSEKEFGLRSNAKHALQIAVNNNDLVLGTKA